MDTHTSFVRGTDPGWVSGMRLVSRDPMLAVSMETDPWGEQHKEIRWTLSVNGPVSWCVEGPMRQKKRKVGK